MRYAVAWLLGVPLSVIVVCTWSRTCCKTLNLFWPPDKRTDPRARQ